MGRHQLRIEKASQLARNASWPSTCAAEIASRFGPYAPHEILPSSGVAPRVPQPILARHVPRDISVARCPSALHVSPRPATPREATRFRALAVAQVVQKF